MPKIQSNNVLKKKSFRSKMFHSLPSKILAFLSFHKHQITQCGIALQITRFQCCHTLPCKQLINQPPFQASSIESQTNQKSYPINLGPQHIEETNDPQFPQETNDPQFPHPPYTYQLTNIIFRRLKLSAVIIFSKEAVQVKKATRGGIFACQMLFHRKLPPHRAKA